MVGSKVASKAIGKVSHYYDKIGVAIITLTAPLKVGDKVKFVKGDDETEQTVDSIQIERTPVEAAKKGAIIGIRVDAPLKEGTIVYVA